MGSNQKMGKQFRELMEKRIDSEEDVKEKEPTSIGLSMIKEQDEAPNELSFAAPSTNAMMPKPFTIHRYFWFRPIPDVEASVKDSVASGLPRIWQEELRD